MPVNDVLTRGVAPASNSGTNQAQAPSNQLTMDSFYKLLAAQLQNQDMNNPMSNSEMMAQMTQMAMMQSIDTLSQVTTTTYGASLVGKEVTLINVDESTGKPSGELKGVVTSVNLFSGIPYLFLDGGEIGYPITRLMAVHAPGYSEKPEKPEEPGEKPEVPEVPGEKPEEPGEKPEEP